MVKLHLNYMKIKLTKKKSAVLLSVVVSDVGGQLLALCASVNFVSISLLWGQRAASHSETFQSALKKA